MRFIVHAALAAIALTAACRGRVRENGTEGATISGQVTAESGAPLNSASVFLEGMNIGTLTREDGRYTFVVPAARVQGQTVTLSARLIGFKQQSINFTLDAGATSQDFELESNPIKMSEVVVTGAGVQTTNERLGEEVFPAAEASPSMSQTNIVRALAGKAPNVQIQSTRNGPVASDASLAPETLAPSMIIRTGTASIEIDSLEPAVARVRELARRVGGFVANTQMAAGHEQVRSATLEIRLPSARFDEILTGLKPIGRVEAVNVNAEDVGEEFVDVTARVDNSHKLEARLIEVLNTRTGKLKDVLDVERELARVREEIERMEGRLRYLRARTSISTFSITVHEAFPVVGERGSTSVMGEAFKQSWRNFVHTIARFIAWLGTAIPTIALLGAAVYVGIRMLKRFGAKRAPAPASE